MDINAKMVELETLWQDSFDLCKAMIASCKSGDQKLTGSILKELNAFIKQSVDFLRYREAEQVFLEEEDNDEDEVLNGYLADALADLAKEDGPLGVPDASFAGDEFPMD